MKIQRDNEQYLDSIKENIEDSLGNDKIKYLEALPNFSKDDLMEMCVTFVQMTSMYLMFNSNVFSVNEDIDVDVAIISKNNYEQKRLTI